MAPSIRAYTPGARIVNALSGPSEVREAAGAAAGVAADEASGAAGAATAGTADGTVGDAGGVGLNGIAWTGASRTDLDSFRPRITSMLPDDTPAAASCARPSFDRSKARFLAWSMVDMIESPGTPAFTIAMT